MPEPREHERAATWLSALRAPQWLHFVALPLAGWDPAAPRGLMVFALLRGVLLAALLLSYGYLLNAIADRGTDVDPRKNPLAGHRNVGSAPVVVAVLTVLAIALASSAPWRVQIASAVMLASGFVYSVGPRWKGVFLLGTVLNVANFLPLLWLGLSSHRVPSHTGVLATLFGVLLLQNQLIHEAADAPEDRSARLHTTFLVLGAKATAALVAVLGLGSAWIAANMLPGSGRSLLATVMTLVLGALFPAWVVLQGQRADAMSRARRWHRYVSALVGALAFGLILQS